MLTIKRPGWAIPDGTLTVVKLMAIAFMLIDHINLYVLYPHNSNQLVLYQIGRIAAPLFCVMIGYNLARPGTPERTQIHRAKSMAFLMLLFGFISYPVNLLLSPFPSVEPNIMFSFLVGVTVVMLIMAVRSRQRHVATQVALYAGVFLFFVLFGSLSEYGFSATGTIVLAYFTAGARSRVARFLLSVLLVGSLVSFSPGNQSVAGMLALPILVLAMFVEIKPVKRIPKLFFYWFYPAHQVVLWMIAAII